MYRLILKDLYLHEGNVSKQAFKAISDEHLGSEGFEIFAASQWFRKLTSADETKNLLLPSTM